MGTSGSRTFPGPVPDPRRKASRPMTFIGMTAAVHSLDLPGTEVTPIYEGFHGYIYGILAEANTVDLDLVRTRLGAGPLRILDLCCGTGRFARALAAEGHTVTAVDLSADMIAQAREMWRPMAADASGEAVFEAADATALEPEEPFDAVLIGGLSVNTFGASKRRSLLEAARSYLRPGGTLLFDHFPTPEKAAEPAYHTFPFPGEDGNAFTVMSVFQAVEEGVQTTNMYSEIIDTEGATRRFLSSETVTYTDPEELRAELERSGLRIVEELDTTPPAGTGASGVPRSVLVRCEAV